MPFRSARRRRRTARVPRAIKTFVRRSIKKSHETKFLLLSTDSTTYGAAALLKLDLLDIDQGITQQERIGHRILITNVFIRAQINHNAVAWNRFMLLWIRDCGAASSISISAQGAIDLDQFTVKLQNFTPLNLTSANPRRTLFMKKVRINKHVQYDGPLGSSFQGPNLGFFGFTDLPVGSIITYEIRVFFKDA